MPRIELISEVLYTANDPIHWEIDNLPLKAILRRQNLINLALDNALEQMRNAIGTQGSLSNRLNQSINPDGSLKTSSIDAALHTMDEHTDTDYYVRMTKDQSDKLDLLADDATNITLTVYTDEITNVELTSGSIEIRPSTTVTPVIEEPNIIKFDLNFPVESAHQHYYGLIPVHVDLLSPNYLDYKVTSVATPFVAGSLRIFINGVRIFTDGEVYVPGSLVDNWSLMSFTEDPENGLFELSDAITEDDIIRIDFDILFS